MNIWFSTHTKKPLGYPYDDHVNEPEIWLSFSSGWPQFRFSWRYPHKVTCMCKGNGKHCITKIPTLILLWTWRLAWTDLCFSATKWPPFRKRHFQIHFFNEKFCISIQTSLKFVPKGPIDNKRAWRRTGCKPYLNQCWSSSLMHICGTRGRWVNIVHLLRVCFVFDRF